MKRVYRIFPALLAALLIFTACKSEPEPSSSEDFSLPDMTEPTIVSLDIESLLTAEEVSAVVGETVTGPDAYDGDAAMIRFATEDERHHIDVMAADATMAEFDEMKQGYTDLTEAPNLGEIGYWSAETSTLVVYREPYMLGIVVGFPGQGDEQLVLARQVMTLVLQRLP